MTESAAERWRRRLRGWAIPQELLEAVPDSPYEWPAELWRRRRSEGEESMTTGLVRGLLGPGGSLLDVGAGTGRASLPLAREGHPLTAVERNRGMAEGLTAEAGELEVRLVEGSWPEAAARVGPHQVALAAHVVYDVQDIGPFLEAMVGRARRAVVLELTPAHPWSMLAPYYRALHELDRPEGPTVDDLADVVREAFGVDPNVELWRRPGERWFQDWEELVGFFGRRLVLPRPRWDELRGLMEPEVVDRDGRLFVGSEVRELATLWWEVPVLA
ncbi:MAG: class I SAM-dependent methyltransferase [Acidimicrobiia bacterium]